MEPLKPHIRDALKAEHPGLSDATLDRVEQLLAERFLIDPDVDPRRIEQLDRERESLLRKEIPRFEQVMQRIYADEKSRRHP